MAPNKVIILYGARRVGKTTLVNKFMEEISEQGFQSEDVLYVSGDDIVARQFLESQSIQKLKDFVGAKKILIIDEAQYIENVGINLKLIVDHIPDIQVLATGSSSFTLLGKTGEPLTGRKFELKLHPIAQLELSQIENPHETAANLENRLIYGGYPEVVTAEDNYKKQLYLREIVGSYLLKDILELEGIRHSKKLLQLLQLLAFQIGKPVSHSELATQVGLSKNTVDRYLDLLEKVFVIYPLSGFSRNLRKEIVKNNKYYFYDNGIRNAIISNFNPLTLRNDVGELWENYIISERLKKIEYLGPFTNFYFWRTYDKKEIDLIEEREGRLFGYEIKWQPGKVKVPTDWARSYPDAGFEIINQENYLQFIT